MKVRKIVGIEMCEESSLMNVTNLALNGMSGQDYEVINEKVENCLQRVITALRQESQGLHYNIIAVLDPPRAGLPSSVIQTIRTCKGLDSLIYVSCNLKAINQNIHLLTQQPNKKVKAPQF